MSTLRFHWDFFGPDARPTAEHFNRHLLEFCSANMVEGPRTFITEVEGGCTASLECDEKHMLLIRDRLRPKRAERLAE